MSGESFGGICFPPRGPVPPCFVPAGVTFNDHTLGCIATHQGDEMRFVFTINLRALTRTGLPGKAQLQTLLNQSLLTRLNCSYGNSERITDLLALPFFTQITYICLKQYFCMKPFMGCNFTCGLNFPIECAHLP